jgi:hypothetical protein
MTKIRWRCVKSAAEPIIRKLAVFSTTKAASTENKPTDKAP